MPIIPQEARSAKYASFSQLAAIHGIDISIFRWMGEALRARGGRISTSPANPTLLDQQPLTQGAGTPSDVPSRSQIEDDTAVPPPTYRQGENPEPKA